jgi:hypothetical protein
VLAKYESVGGEQKFSPLVFFSSHQAQLVAHFVSTLQNQIKSFLKTLEIKKKIQNSIYHTAIPPQSPRGIGK